MEISFENGRFSIVFAGKRFFYDPPILTEFESDKKTVFTDFAVKSRKDEVKATSVSENLTLTVRFTADNDLLRIENSVENGGEDIKLGICTLAENITSEIFDNYKSVLVTGENMIGVEGIRPFDRDRTSESFAALTDSYGNGAFIVGFTDSRRERHTIELKKDGSKLTAVAYRDGTTLKKGAILDFGAFVVGFDSSLNTLVGSYGDLLARDSEAVFSQKRIAGWCDWYYFYGFATDKMLLDEARKLKASPIGDKIEYFQIDDGWENRTPGAEHNWGDWEKTGPNFPMGMKPFADAVHEIGFKAGIWLAPFTVSKISHLYRDHPDWALVDGSTETLGTIDYPLDLSNPEVVAFIKKTFERVFNEWGFDYIKIDFLGMAMREGKRHSREKTIAEYYYDALKMIKTIAGDRHVLGCGPAIFQSIGAVDSMRIGPDVGNRWDIFGTDWGDTVGGNCSIKPCINNTIRRQWMHGRIWQNDPDCMMAREKCNPYEKILYGETLFGIPWSDKLTCIDDVTFDSWLKTIWFLSLPNVLSEVWDVLSPERQKKISEMYDVPNRKIGYVDYYPSPEVCVMKTEDDDETKPQMIAVFNLSDKAETIILPSEIAGGTEWKYAEEKGDGSFEGKGGVITFPEVRPHGVTIWKKVK